MEDFEEDMATDESNNDKIRKVLTKKQVEEMAKEKRPRKLHEIDSGADMYDMEKIKELKYKLTEVERLQHLLNTTVME